MRHATHAAVTNVTNNTQALRVLPRNDYKERYAPKTFQGREWESPKDQGQLFIFLDVNEGWDIWSEMVMDSSLSSHWEFRCWGV